MAIRQTKKKDWDGVPLVGRTRSWALRERAAREDAVEDLLKRRNRAVVKIEAAASPPSVYRQLCQRRCPSPAARDPDAGSSRS